MNHHGRWRIGALASAIALLGSLASLEAHAVALGRITVQSALGESLRAEIDISDLSAEEASSLRIGIANAEVFKSAGLEYSAAAAGLDVRLQRRADGRSYLRLSSNRAIIDPFVDLVIEAKSASGRVTRDYTMLFDPPSLRNNSTSIAASTPVLPRAPVTNADISPREATPAAPYSRPAARPPVSVAKPPAIRTPSAERMPGARQVTVRPGDNASKIAARNKPASVSLDQMLVALLRGNPEAFVGGNINVIKSGAVVDIPDEQAATALSPGEARQTLIAQSRDFNTFRRKLADGVPATQVDSAGRQTGGQMQAKVDDRAQASPSPDKLTLSKGAVQGKLADEQSARDAASRVADSSKNINNPNQPGAVPVTGSAAPGLAVPVPAPGATTAAGSPEITATPALAPASASASATDAGQAPVSSASEPVAAASAPAPVVPAVNKQAAMVAPPPAPLETSLIDQILDNSLLLGGGLLVALLAGLGFARYRKTAKSGQVDSSFLDSRLQPDSFFGASGGRRVDTNTSNVGGSSMVYSPSQLDAAGDVDPVAEADVYLAYGRDQQAEEILKEALRLYPARLAIHTKLLEIFAKRRDNKEFESLALTAFKLSGGQGAEWSYISQLGRELEPGNSLYQSGAEFSGSLPAKVRSGLIPLNAIAPQEVAVSAPVLKTAPVLDLDLDFSLDEAPAASMAPAAIAAPAPIPARSITESSSNNTRPSALMNLDDLDLDLDLDLNLDDIAVSAPVSASPSARSPSAPAKAPSPEIDFLSGGLDFTPEPYVPPKASIAPPAPVNHDGMLEFDLNSLSLDLGPATKPPVSDLMGLEEDPLEIKFLLAEEFRILGDSEGARSLADEVLAKAKGPLKFKAQAFINALS